MSNFSGMDVTIRGVPNTWAVQHAPAISVQATITKAAGATGIRHVVTAVSFTMSASTAPAATALQVNLRDGASGAGTILQSWSFQIPATVIQPTVFGLSGLWIPGSQATAMTLEFSALLTSLMESVNLVGYDDAF